MPTQLQWISIVVLRLYASDQSSLRFDHPVEFSKEPNATEAGTLFSPAHTGRMMIADTAPPTAERNGDESDNGRRMGSTY